MFFFPGAAQLAPPNYPLRYPKYHLMETIRPLVEVHWGVYEQLSIFSKESGQL